MEKFVGDNDESRRDKVQAEHQSFHPPSQREDSAEDKESADRFATMESPKVCTGSEPQMATEPMPMQGTELTREESGPQLKGIEDLSENTPDLMLRLLSEGDVLKGGSGGVQRKENVVASMGRDDDELQRTTTIGDKHQQPKLKREDDDDVIDIGTQSGTSPMGTPVKCFNCNGGGHFVRECPSTKSQNGNGNSASAPSTPRFWTPRRNPEENEEREFLKQLIQEKREEQARRRELDEQIRFDEKLRSEMARYAEATKAEIMAAVGRQYLGQGDEARREELKRGWCTPPLRKDDHRLEEDLGDVDDIDLEIRRLELLREKRRRGKEPVRGGINFRQPSFSTGPGRLMTRRFEVNAPRMEESGGGRSQQGLVQRVYFNMFWIRRSCPL
ncbi:hypothetical protein CBR_g16034 [Chara braunii]|uniref:CCHC-type domain-containing protein n=1 Tax=Chara braunii TaxID=69332 RepID=A0A388JT24_CHABU|nr:hypothetical protein CBR_g16034 [Chara braunii]|eukprot:GBG60913.1 hypothetical protein CBR_g16034 [Chara braunii]